MTRATIVRYTTRPESAEENERLIRAVFAQLADRRPEGLRYASFRLDDGVSFVHVALTEGDGNPLNDLPAFGEFVAAIADRCTEPPVAKPATVVGAFRMATDPG